MKWIQFNKGNRVREAGRKTLCVQALCYNFHWFISRLFQLVIASQNVENTNVCSIHLRTYKDKEEHIYREIRESFQKGKKVSDSGPFSE